MISREAFKLAGDPTKFPEQIKDGLRPWQPKKLYHLAAFGFPGEPPVSGRVLRVNCRLYDPLLGKTYTEIGTEARSMHKCQGMAQLLSLPAPPTAMAASYQLVETTIPGAAAEGRDVAVRRRRQQHHEPGAVCRPFDRLRASPRAEGSHRRPHRDRVAVQAAQKTFDAATDEATLKPLQAGLYAVRVLRRELRTMSIDDAGKYEIDFRLRQKEGEFQQAIVLAHGIKIEALADDGVVVPGQPVKVNVIVANRATGDVAIKHVGFDGFSTATRHCTMTAFSGGGFNFPGAGRGRGRRRRRRCRACARIRWRTASRR